MNLVFPGAPILTSRLALRSFAADDFAAYAEYHHRPEVYRFLYMAAPQGEALRAQFADVLSAPFARDGDTCRLAVVRQDDRAVLGEVLLKVASVQALQLEVGYIFHPRHAGQGYATEAVEAMLGWGFDGLGRPSHLRAAGCAQHRFRQGGGTAGSASGSTPAAERPLQRRVG